jgi:hypothetical protein
MNTRAFEISGDNGSVILFDDGSFIDTVQGDAYLGDHLPQFSDVNEAIHWANENAQWDSNLAAEWWQDTLSGIEGLCEYVGA